VALIGRLASEVRISRVWPGWSHLPRDARDTLFLLFVIGWTVLPHASHLPLWCSLLTLVVLLWRARLAIANAPLPGRWALVAVLIVAAALTFWSYNSLLGKEPGVTLAVVLMALKTLELRARWCWPTCRSASRAYARLRRSRRAPRCSARRSWR